MHIPDGYLSPQTSLTMYVVSVPFLMSASQKIKKRLDMKIIPMISLFSAFSFLIMMFNVPLPGGTTGHAVGTVLTSIVLGPWIGIIATTVALVIQAIFFGDGGILSLGANIWNMAIVMAIVGFFIYQLMTKLIGNSPKRRAFAGAIAGYIAINMSALFTGVELGLQPLLFHTAAGKSLYFPYGLNVSIPAMLVGHLTIAGLAEALITGLGVSWIYRNKLSLATGGSSGDTKPHGINRLAISFFLILIILTPLGLLAPGTAWGEWDRKKLQTLGLGYIPKGFDRWNGIWTAPLSGYTVGVLHNATAGYLLSGILGVIVTFCVMYGSYFILKKFTKNKTI